MRWGVREVDAFGDVAGEAFNASFEENFLGLVNAGEDVDGLFGTIRLEIISCVLTCW